MRRLETEDVVLYYSEGGKQEAERIGDRLDRRVRACFSGQEPISVVPTYNTADVFALLGIALDPGLVGCHEMVHYVHSLQTGGLGYTVSSILGPLYSPQMGLDPWFQEGLAVFYETKLQPGVGRLRSRYFEGILAAAAAEGDLDTGTPPPAVGSWCERRSGSRP